MDGGAGTFVVEQGKGTRQVNVESGKTYHYILTDSGKQLERIPPKPNNRQMKQSKMNLDAAQPPIFVRAVAGAKGLRRFRASLVGLFCAICLLMPSPAEAECRQWDAGGQWKLQQGDLVVIVNLRQSDKSISGTARYTDIRKKTFNGSVAGTVDGSNITLDMNWDDGSGGVYKGVIGANGKIKGTVHVDKRDPSKIWAWYSIQAMKCADAKPAAQPQPVQFDEATLRADPFEVKIPAGQTEGTTTLTWDAGNHPDVKLGINVNNTGERVARVGPKGSVKTSVARGTTIFRLLSGSKWLHEATVIAKASTNAPPPSAPSTTGPKITASPSVVTIPAGQTTGTTTLTWDAGPNHPYAEVWVTVDGGDERKIVEQGKGSRQVQVSAGKTYLYILTDSGKQLATTTVKAK